MQKIDFSLAMYNETLFFKVIFKHCDVAKLPPFLPFKFVSAAAVAAKDSSALNLTGKSPFQG